LLLVGGLLIVVGLAATALTTPFSLTRDDAGPRARPAAAGTATTTGAIAENPPIPAQTSVPPPVAEPVADPAAPATPPPDWSPRAVRIPKIEVDAPVDALGVDDKNALQVPSDPTRVGWWLGGAQPGQPDPAVLVGHLDSSTGPAVFFKLEQLVPGDVIEVDRADASTARFMVERLESHPKTEFPTLSVYGATDTSTLRLITCFGAFDPVARSYENNLVIYANLLP